MRRPDAVPHGRLVICACQFLRLKYCSEVDKRARQAGDRYPPEFRGVAPVEFARGPGLHASDPPPGRRSDLRGRRGTLEQPEQVAGCEPAQHGAVPTGPNGGEIVRLDASRLMSHPINAAVFPDEGALADSPLYRGSRHPEREELAARDDSMPEARATRSPVVRCVDRRSHTDL